MSRNNLFFSLSILVVFFVALYFFPWSKMQWGALVQRQARTITVIGTASSTESNDIATFYAGAEFADDNKDTATSEVNKKMEQLFAALTTFGIPAEDIQTSNMGVYQTQESYYDEGGRQKTRPGQWRVNNSVTIKLRDIERVDELNDLLVASGLTNVSGPNFAMDESSVASNDLISQAVDNAREKAQAVAISQDVALGAVVNITEGTVNQVFPMSRASVASGGGGGPTAPGSSLTNASVVVTFELE